LKRNEAEEGKRYPLRLRGRIGRPMNRRLSLLAIILLAGLTTSLPCDAAIIRLRRTAEVDAALIRLGDLAEVYSESAEEDARLKGIAIKPAPLAGTRLRLSVSEIQSQLSLRGVAAGELEVEGSAVVLVTRKPKPRLAPEPKVIHPGPASKKDSPPVKPIATTRQIKRRTLISDVSAEDFKLARQVVENAVQQYLDRSAPGWGHPQSHPLLTTAVAPRILNASAGNVRILSGQMLDEEHFLLTLAVPETQTKVDHVDVKVRIIRRPKIYVPVRTVSKGEVLQENDLAQVETDDARNGITDPAEVVGKEVVQPLTTGKAIRSGQLKEPLLIKRRETVQVVSRSGSIRVRQFFVAKEDGHLGDTIVLEELDGKETISATVTGHLKAEIGGTTAVSPEQNSDRVAAVNLTVLRQ
jgi:flagella basal body P-ring formation protein FlgA